MAFMMHFIKNVFEGPWMSICSVAQKISFGKSIRSYHKINFYLMFSEQKLILRGDITFFLRHYDDFLRHSAN